MQKIGQRISPILKEMNDTLWEYEAHHPGVRMGWSDQDLNYATKIFMCVLMDRMFEYNEGDGERLRLADEAGKTMRSLIRHWTTLDTAKLVEDDLNAE